MQNETKIYNSVFLANICYNTLKFIIVDRGTVRLVRSGVFSSTYTAGIVQIYYYTSSSTTNRWGNICYDTSTFGSTEANVICNQLGYNGVSSGGYGRAGSTSRYNMITIHQYMYLCMYICMYMQLFIGIHVLTLMVGVRVGVDSSF